MSTHRYTRTITENKIKYRFCFFLNENYQRLHLKRYSGGSLICQLIQVQHFELLQGMLLHQSEAPRFKLLAREAFWQMNWPDPTAFSSAFCARRRRDWVSIHTAQSWWDAIETMHSWDGCMCTIVYSLHFFPFTSLHQYHTFIYLCLFICLFLYMSVHLTYVCQHTAVVYMGYVLCLRL